ncbi:MAG: hypothetical protein QOF96_2773, partial [Actinomycetota bacterium]|nr:hypothetical protein [Actinomycetota bacterium]
RSPAPGAPIAVIWTGSVVGGTTKVSTFCEYRKV